MAHSVVISDCC